MQGLCRVVQDFGAIAEDEDLIVILPNGLADPLGMELFRIVKWSTYDRKH